jgi:transcriptional regulator of heat shock response
MLSTRQIQLLHAIIDEYILSAEPVGSTLIVEKYNMKCSPATIRNEMAKLLDDGYLQMLHTSSGRIPTTFAYKYYLEELMIEDELDVLQEVALKQRLWSNRYEFEKMLRQAVLSLSEITKEVALATTEDGYVIHAGAVNLLDYREFWDIDIAKNALMLLDRYELLERIFEKMEASPNEIKYLIGEDLGSTDLRDVGIVAANYSVGKRSGYVCVLGPSRMNYGKVMPAVRYTKNLVQELGGSW